MLRTNKGTSLIEMMISLMTMLTVSGSAFYAMTTYQKSSRSSELKTNLHGDVRGALELMTQEIGQAGSLSFTPRTLGAAVTASANTQSVTVSSISNIFVGEKLLVDTGTAQELVGVTAITLSSTSITAVFANSHSSGAVVNAAGVFPTGVLSSSTATQLQLFGDINGDGNLVYVQYDCNATAGTLSRSSTAISYKSDGTASSISASDVLDPNIIANPGGIDCFQYQKTTTGGYTFVTNIAVTISARTASPDPQTNAYVTMTKSLLNISPRNVLDALTLTQASIPVTARLQPTPPGLPLH